MPAKITSDIQGPTMPSISLLPPANLGISKRSISTGTNRVDSISVPTPAVGKPTTAFPGPPSPGGKFRAAILPDLRQPPPISAFSKPGNVCLPPTAIGCSCLPYNRFPQLLDNTVLSSMVDLIPSVPIPQILCLEVDSTLKSVRGGNQQPCSQTQEVTRPGSSGTPEMFKMSPCLRPDSSPCADDLGNYAMHVSQMELVWHGEFDRLFTQYYPHAWYLVPTFYPPSDRWRVFKDSAKVRFSCQECGHGWTSMKGRVIFWFHLNYTTNSGYVMFKLYGQQCQKCKNGSYEHAMWYPEEVVKVIGNVYNRVGQVFYGFVRPPLRIDRRQGKPRNQHNAELCQACKEGLCKEEWSFS